MIDDPEVDINWCLEGITDCFDTSLINASIEEIKANNDPPEPIIADTDQSLTFDDLINVFDKISKPTTMDDVPLSVDPDDIPVI